MRFIFENYYNAIVREHAKIGKLMSTPAVVSVTRQKVKDEAADFEEMYVKFMRNVRVVTDGTHTYIGDANYDIFRGSKGNTVRGLVALRRYAETLDKELCTYRG